MDKIVKKGLKIDLHIHSVYSSNKDKDIVKNNTLDNLPILVNKLNEYGIEMCSITDHDIFNYDMYAALKREEKNNGSIKKVLPGVEFSVSFDDKIIHIVTIFDDKDDNKLRNMQTIFVSGLGKQLYKQGAYTREDYYKILEEINLDFVMIAHQKKSPKSPQGPQKKDVLSLGEEKFNELVMLEYFDAYEFHEKNNEIHNKLYAQEKNFGDKLRFITGTDCHDWLCYPYYGPGKTGDVKFTYIKSLPTFKGLAMAVTDIHRINFTDSFFGQGKYQDTLEFEIDGDSVNIPLSRGINVIIGDNSIGKSLLLHEITDNRELDKSAKSKVKNGYKKYLDKNKIQVKTRIQENDIFKFNYQGNVREIFDNPNLKADTYLKEYAPDDINTDKYRRPVQKEFERLYESIQRKLDYNKKVDNLQRFKLLENEPSDKELIFEGEVSKIVLTDLRRLVKNLGEIIEKIRDEILVNPELLSSDETPLKNQIELLEMMAKRYENSLHEKEQENKKINIFNTCVRVYKEEYKTRQTDENNAYQSYIENIKSTIADITELVNIQQAIKPFEFDIADINVVPEQNHVDKFIFVSKIDVEKIDNKYLEDLLSGVLKAGRQIDILKLTEESLHDAINRFPNEAEDALDGLKQKIATKMDGDFKPTQSIIENDKDVFEELSDGFDAKMYFRLLSGEERNKGIYIVDQPEDHISPIAIKNEVIDQFRSMSKKRQIIMVTHNPQFIVNLDVDNVIFLSKKNDKYLVQSGALEYEDDSYGILDVVAQNIDGGLDTIRKRMKRYDKDIQV